ALALGQVAAALDRRAPATAHLERALERAERDRCDILIGRAALALSELSVDEERAAKLRERARDAFLRADLPARAEAIVLRAPAAAREGPLALAREENLWRVTWGARTFWVRDGKGMSYLDELVRQAGKEIHVAELTGAALGEELPIEG